MRRVRSPSVICGPVGRPVSHVRSRFRSGTMVMVMGGATQVCCYCREIPERTSDAVRRVRVGTIDSGRGDGHMFHRHKHGADGNSSAGRQWEKAVGNVVDKRLLPGKYPPHPKIFVVRLHPDGREPFRAEVFVSPDDPN